MIGELAAFGAAVSWTISAVLYKRALSETKPVSANIVRLACTGGILVLALAVLGKLEALMSLSPHVIALAGVSGIIGLGLGDTLYMVSLQRVGVARAVPITCTYPFFNLLWSFLLVGEMITFSVVLGAVVIVFGIWLLSEKREAGIEHKARNTLALGVAFALATAIAWSVSITMMDVALALPEGESMDFALVVNTVRVVAIAVAFLALSPVVDRNLGFLKMRKRNLGVLIFGGIVALGFGWFFLAYSFAVGTPESRAVPISSTTPLFSTLAGMSFLHEKVTWRSVLGSIAIVAGIFLIFLV